MRINFGCGRQVLDGWFNTDAVLSPKAPRAPELLHAVKFTPDGKVENPLPLPDGATAWYSLSVRRADAAPAEGEAVSGTVTIRASASSWIAQRSAVIAWSRRG